MHTSLGRPLLAAALLLTLPSLATAQVTSAGQRWFAGGAIGGTFGTVTGAAIGAHVGVRIAPSLFVIGDVARLQNVVPGDIRDGIRDEINAIALELGVPILFDFTMRATTAFGGVRWQAEGRLVAPFLEGGLGIGHVKVHINRFDIFGNDVRDELGDIFDDATATKPLMAVGGGVTGRLRPSLTMDAGYRFMRIATEDPALNVSLLYVAFNLGR